MDPCDSLSAWFDGELSPAAMLAFECHLLRCEVCLETWGILLAIDAAAARVMAARQN